MNKRSTWKGPFIEPKLLKRVQIRSKVKSMKTIKTWSRSSTILPNFIGLKILIHNGKNFLPIYINEKMVGRKLGEFSVTRKFDKHSNKDINKKQKDQKNDKSN